MTPNSSNKWYPLLDVGAVIADFATKANGDFAVVWEYVLALPQWVPVEYKNECMNHIEKYFATRYPQTT